jgi:DNA-binding response OmpR family regulator
MMQPNTTVLVVDDDPAIGELMRDFLEADGFAVQVVHDGQTALERVRGNAIACVLLDIMMPGLSGFDLCRAIRAAQDVPILFLSARDTDADKIRGLGLGGDDYIVKSATPSEVVARIKAVLRRYRQASPAAEQATLDFGHFTVDLRAREVKVDGQPVALAAREFELLAIFATNPRQVFTHEQLFDQLWGEYGDRHTVAVHVNRLRQKLEPDPANPAYFTTVWGVGYRFEGVHR